MTLPNKKTIILNRIQSYQEKRYRKRLESESNFSITFLPAHKAHSIALSVLKLSLNSNVLFFEVPTSLVNNGIFIHVKMDDQGVYFDTLKQAALCPACGLPTAFGFCLNPACPTKG